MLNRTLFWLKKLFNLKTQKFEDVNVLYEHTYRQIKKANTRKALRKTIKLMYKLDKLTKESYNNPLWMRNRNKTLKMLWILKFNNLKK